MFLILLIAFFINTSNAYYKIPFESFGEGFEDMFGLVINASVGTPYQQTKLFLIDYYDDTSPALATKIECDEAVYDPDKSSTFYIDSYRRNGMSSFYGSDVISFNENYVHKNVSFSSGFLGEEFCWKDGSILSFGRSTQAPSFVRDYLRTQTNPIAIFSFAQVGNTIFEKTSGTLVFGEKPTDLCADDYQYFNAKVFVASFVANDWAIEADTIQVGKYVHDHPGHILFDWNEFTLLLPQRIFDSVMKILDATFDIDDRPLANCKLSTPIQLIIDGKTLAVGPDLYIDQTGGDENGNCPLNIDASPSFILMPVQFLRGKCILYDYTEDNPKLALATSKNKP